MVYRVPVVLGDFGWRLSRLTACGRTVSRSIRRAPKALSKRNSEFISYPLRIVFKVDRVVLAVYLCRGHLQSQEAGLGIVIGGKSYVRERSLKRGNGWLAGVWVLRNLVHGTLTIRVTTGAGDDIWNLF